MIETILSLPIYITLPVILIGYSAACLGVGILLLKWLAGRLDSVERTSAGTLLATGFILGEGILASVWLLLALAGWFSIQVVGAVCLVLMAAGLYAGRSLLSGFGKQVRSVWRELREDTWGWQFLAGLTVVLCLAWVTSLGRPLQGDGPAFYFALSKLIAFSHRLVPMPGYEVFTNVGLQGELHFAALMALHSPEAAKLFSWPTISMAGIMLASLGRVTGMGRRGQWLTLSMLFSSSAVIWLSGDGKVDLFAVAFGLAAYYWAIQLRFSHTRMALLLTGLFSGFAIVAKLSYAPVIVPTIGLLVLWGYAGEFRYRSLWRATLRAFLAGCMVIFLGLIPAFLPHLVKNGLLFHNPIAPIGSGNSTWLIQTWYGPAITRHILLTYPLALTYGSFWAQYGNLSPLILAFLPLAYYLSRPRPFLSSPLVVLTLTALLGIVTWSVYDPSVFSPRYILAALLLLILLPARAAEYISLNDQRPRLLAAAIPVLTATVMVSTGLYFIDQVFFPSHTVQYLTGALDECERDGAYCTAMEKINQRAGAGSRVYLASFQHYWFRGDLLQCISRTEEAVSTGLSGEGLWLKLYERGFDYLLIDASAHALVLQGLDPGHLPKWVALKLIYDKPPLTVYQMTFTPPPSMIEPVVCQRHGLSTIWDVARP
jgi:hypothetical protein